MSKLETYGIKEVTPMMEHWLTNRKSLPEDVLTSFKIGDFYEFFGVEAVKVASILGLTITKRRGNPMCGIPYHVIRAWSKELVSKGYRVALFELTEEPKAGEVGIRELVEVIGNESNDDE